MIVKIIIKIICVCLQYKDYKMELKNNGYKTPTKKNNKEQYHTPTPSNTTGVVTNPMLLWAPIKNKNEQYHSPTPSNKRNILKNDMLLRAPKKKRHDLHLKFF